MDGPLIGGTCVDTELVAPAMAIDGTGSGRFAVSVLRITFGGGSGAGKADNGSSAAAPAFRRGSSEVPHIPQKRKLDALSSLQLGQITISLQKYGRQQFNSCRHPWGPHSFILKCRRPVSVMPKTSKAKHSRSQLSPKRFEARLERMRSRLNWIIVHIPFDAAKVWGLRGQIKVKGEINGFGFRTSLFPTKEGQHILLVNKKMQKGALAKEGSVAHFKLEIDGEERTVIPPSELASILSQDRALQRWYEKLNHSTRADIAKWVSDTKSGEARVRRAEQIAERLLSVLEAERELPPILQVAFARDPGAREDWDHMSISRRRGHLFGIFYYRSRDAQQRRIGKMLEDATLLAEKIEGRKR